MTEDVTNGGAAGGTREPTADEQAALGALKQLPHPKAASEVRERARAAFLRGEASPGTSAMASTEPRRRSPRLLPLALTAAIAAIVIAVFSYGNQPAHDWFVTDIVEPAGVQTGETTPGGGIRLTAGLVSTGETSELEVQLGSQVRFRMLPGTTIDLPRPPGRWFGKSRTIRLSAGEIYGTTGEQPLAFDLQVETSEAMAQIFGTTFAVLKLDIGTCVCLWTGGVMVMPKDGDDGIRLPDEMKYYVYNDGRPNEMMPIEPMERMKLSMTHDAGLTLPESETP